MGINLKNATTLFSANYFNNDQELPGAIILYNPSKDQKLWNKDFRFSVLHDQHFKRGRMAMVVLVVLHMLRVIFYGAYKYPREVSWFSGVFLLLVTVGFGFTGYLLPWDQKAYWATTVGTHIAGTPPFIGDTILRIVRGGDQLSAVTLARFFGVHVWVLPTFLLLLTAIHMYLVIRLGISAVPKRGE